MINKSSRNNKILYELFLGVLAVIISVVTILDLMGRINISNNMFLTYLDNTVLLIFAADYFFSCIDQLIRNYILRKIF